jgi:L-seryl-tRNA(Ser) seleniumtransferase
MTEDKIKSELRKLPSVEKVLSAAAVQPLIDRYSRALVTDALQELLADARKRIRGGESCPSPEQVVTELEKNLNCRWAGLLSPVINATGIVLHTNLGRAPLPEDSLSAVAELGGGYGALELDLVSGERGHRAENLEGMLCRLSGAESALVVNNNAAAVYLILMVLAKGKEAIVSRGELVQIGGGFRIPEVMAESGVTLKEVGTTNQTYAEDYKKAIGKKTALILKVHQSNFAIRGFSHEAGFDELKELAGARKLPLLCDLGSGTLLDTADYGLEHEPTIQETVKSADIVCFSGDKLLGGPQAGIIVGKKKYIDKLRKHPLMRTLRVGRLVVTALEATLIQYLKQEEAQIPVWKMLGYTVEDLEARAMAIAAELKKAGLDAQVVDGRSAAGGGSLPDQYLKSKLVSVKPAGSIDSFAAKLRLSSPPVLGRIEEGRFLIDVRTVAPQQDGTLLEVIRTVLGG